MKLLHTKQLIPSKVVLAQLITRDEAVEEDLAAVDLELERLNADKTDAATQKATVFFS